MFEFFIPEVLHTFLTFLYHYMWVLTRRRGWVLHILFPEAIFIEIYVVLGISIIQIFIWLITQNLSFFAVLSYLETMFLVFTFWWLGWNAVLVFVLGWNFTEFSTDSSLRIWFLGSSSITGKNKSEKKKYVMD